MGTSQAIAHGSFAPVIKTGSKRLASIDIVRGLAVVFMALDHIRDYISNIPFSPENIDRTWMAYFPCPLGDAPLRAGVFSAVEKYPPSLEYLLMTLGPIFILLAVAGEPIWGWVGKVLSTYGRVPLFLLHPALVCRTCGGDRCGCDDRAALALAAPWRIHARAGWD